MYLIVGLGNPGEKYSRTRHNVGFEALGLFAENNLFPEFSFSDKFNALVSKKENIVLALPQTFMNNSGKAVASIKSFYKINPENIIIIHDDIDILLGKTKISKDSGSAGHRGVDSIIKELGTKDFYRIRIGICPEKGKPNDTEKFVLKKFPKKEEAIIKESILESAESIKKLIIPCSNTLDYETPV